MNSASKAMRVADYIRERNKPKLLWESIQGGYLGAEEGKPIRSNKWKRSTQR